MSNAVIDGNAGSAENVPGLTSSWTKWNPAQFVDGVRGDPGDDAVRT